MFEMVTEMNGWGQWHRYVGVIGNEMGKTTFVCEESFRIELLILKFIYLVLLITVCL